MVINYSLGDSINFIKKLSVTDTIILSETIEHIDSDEFDSVFAGAIKPLLQRTNGLLIITNWIDFHPIPVNPPWHVREVNDELYDWLAKDGEIVYRMGSHLVVRY